MPQLTEDEWPRDGEPTTAEQEDGEFKSEGPNPPGRKTGHSIDEMNREPDEPVITNIDPDHRVD